MASLIDRALRFPDKHLSFSRLFGRILSGAAYFFAAAGTLLLLDAHEGFGLASIALCFMFQIIHLRLSRVNYDPRGVRRQEI